MVYSLTYRRPPHVNSSTLSLSGHEKPHSIGPAASVRSHASSSSLGIPNALSFDRIISGGTCPPCTTRDFMNFLKYVEHAAENLQFWLWYRDYVKRFSELPSNEQCLAPEWTEEQAEAETANQNPPTAPKKISPETAKVLAGTDFALNKSRRGNPFETPPGTPSVDAMKKSSPSVVMGEVEVTEEDIIHAKAANAFEKADLKWQPFTIQPFREEITRIIAIYVADGSPRQLNLSAKERAALLHALNNTTHPSAFAKVASTVEWSLRHQAHPNFIRWSICNGNRPRVIFARGLGIGGIVAGIIAGILITLSGAGRGWRVLSAAGFLIGISTLIAAWKGMCVVLHGMHHRHLRPWELFADDDDEAGNVEMKKSFDSMGSSNSYEDEPWVARYDKRNVIRKIFDRQIWIQEPALRQIQDTIFLQALGGALIITAILVGIFVAVPKGRYY